MRHRLQTKAKIQTPIPYGLQRFSLLYIVLERIESDDFKIETLRQSFP